MNTPRAAPIPTLRCAARTSSNPLLTSSSKSNLSSRSTTPDQAMKTYTNLPRSSTTSAISCDRSYTDRATPPPLPPHLRPQPRGQFSDTTATKAAPGSNGNNSNRFSLALRQHTRNLSDQLKNAFQLPNTTVSHAAAGKGGSASMDQQNTISVGTYTPLSASSTPDHEFGNIRDGQDGKDGFVYVAAR